VGFIFSQMNPVNTPYRIFKIISILYSNLSEGLQSGTVCSVSPPEPCSENEKDIDSKIATFLKITGIMNNIFKHNKVRKNTRIKLYSTLALPVIFIRQRELDH
jgi:hypothetical protein